MQCPTCGDEVPAADDDLITRELIGAGRLTAEEARDHPYRSMIGTCALCGGYYSSSSGPDSSDDPRFFDR
jgi:hypothetical protein